MHNDASALSGFAFEMPAAALHDAPNPVITEGFIGTERAFLHGTFELAFKSLN